VALLEGELTDAQREANPANGTGMSAEEVARLISAAEAKYEARLAELRGRLDTIEKERVEADAEWNSKVAAKALEVEELKKVVGKSQKSEVDHEAVEEKLRGEITDSEGGGEGASGTASRVPEASREDQGFRGESTVVSH
jgi:hypothetical protein